jgi:hypothetical protein
MRRVFAFVCLAGLIFVVTACGRQGGGAAPSSASGNSSYKTKFPLPASVSNFTDTGNDSINFQTQIPLKEAVSFYRGAFTKSGLTERTINTAITDTTFSLVFDGDPSGKTIVVQGVDLGNGTTNVNIRYEDV